MNTIWQAIASICLFKLKRLRKIHKHKQNFRMKNCNFSFNFHSSFMVVIVCMIILLFGFFKLLVYSINNYPPVQCISNPYHAFCVVWGSHIEIYTLSHTQNNNVYIRCFKKEQLTINKTPLSHSIMIYI